MRIDNLSKISLIILRKAALIFTGLVFTLVFLEMCLRAAGFVSNSLHEIKNRSSISQKDSYRIMCLGESTTAKQYPSFLEEILNGRDIGIKFSVIDKGINGTNSSAILSLLEKNLKDYKPDMVIAMFGCNDKGEIMYYKNIPEANSGLFRYLKIYKLARIIYMHILNRKTFTAKNNAVEAKLIKEIKLSPKDGSAYAELGSFYKRQGMLPRGERFFEKLIKLNSGNALAYIELGVIYRLQGRPLEAAKILKKAIELNPAIGRSYNELGIVCRAGGKLPEAEQLLKKGIEIDPGDEQGYTELARIYRRQGRLPEAEQLLKKGIEIDPYYNELAYGELVALYRMQGRLAEAEELLRKAIEINPKDKWNNDKFSRGLISIHKEINTTQPQEEYPIKTDDKISLITVNNYYRLKETLDEKGIRLVCVQYPMRSIEPLKKVFDGMEGVIFVDNSEIFRTAVKRDGYKDYFIDMFGGDFGHCTPKGNGLLAGNIANSILVEAFAKKSLEEERIFVVDKSQK